jgi:zinc transporter ZupT
MPLDDASLAALGAFAGGALLYIAGGHLLPEAQSEHRRPAIAGAFAVSLLGTVLFIGATHEHAHVHDHGHDDAHEHADDEVHDDA